MENLDRTRMNIARKWHTGTTTLSTTEALLIVASNLAAAGVGDVVECRARCIASDWLYRSAAGAFITAQALEWVPLSVENVQEGLYAKSGAGAPVVEWAFFGFV